MLNCFVTGMGFWSSLGSLAKSWENLLAGESGIRLHQPFLELSPRPLGLIDPTPAQFSNLTQQVVAAALKDAGLVAPLPDCGVVVGSSRGCQGEWEKLTRGRGEVGTRGKKGWLETLPNQGAIAAAHQIGTTAPVLAPMAACATGIWAIAQGLQLIQTGQCRRVIAGAVEAPITPLTLAGFQKMGALAKTGCYPFDRHREGLVLGEGAAVVVLESADSALSRGVPIYGQLLGLGFTCDAYHLSAPHPEGHGAIAAVKQCLNRSHLCPTDIDYIHAHGTSTKLNDCTEAQLIQELFPQGVPVSSTKGATGHTLGASGAIGAAFCLMAFQHQVLPPCVGLTEPAFDLDFVTSPRHTKVKHALCFSFGFGGQNGVIVLRQWNSNTKYL
ncbi:MAG: 3-oxoacyl-ACP synthase [Cyanobacteria bacterium QS_9_48_30]|nr:MAG: 3-oxoacyl-ACP synthase [Cyanobacteria bacterium QS_9_48_30]